MFVKYQHIERFGTQETEGIENGTCYVFPKIDGTNASLWQEDGAGHAGSRRKELSLGKDNAGFLAWALNRAKLAEFFNKNYNLRLYGEWLVPHSLKTYRATAWRDFYVFDVVLANLDEENRMHIPYEEYKSLLEEFGVNYIPPIRVIKNGCLDDFVKLLDQNQYLIEDGGGVGEGIVIKNYEFVNRYGRQTWAKIVTSEFKEKHTKEMVAPSVEGKKLVEDGIIKEFCTEALITKTFEKIKLENGGWTSKYISQLLGRVYHDLVVEETWNFVKKFKNPTINFKMLNNRIILKIRETLPEIF